MKKNSSNSLRKKTGKRTASLRISSERKRKNTSNSKRKRGRPFDLPPKRKREDPFGQEAPSARRPEDAAMYCYQPLFRRRKVKKRPPHPHRACWPPGPSCRTQGNLPRRYLSFVLSVAMCPAACRYLYVWLRVRLFCLSVCTPPSLARLVWFMYVSSACGHVYLCLFYGAIFFLCVKPCLRWPYALLLVSVFVL